MAPGSVEVEVTFSRHVHATPIAETVGGATNLCGYGIYETTGSAAAKVLVYDGHDSTGQVVVPVELAEGTSATIWYGSTGIDLKIGLYVDVVSGSAGGSVYWSNKDE